MACMCGDTQCSSCGPAQGNGKCPACGEWQDDHAEHELLALTGCAEGILTFLKSLASGVSPMDFHSIRTKARDLLVEMQKSMEQEGCGHEDESCASERASATRYWMTGAEGGE